MCLYWDINRKFGVCGHALQFSHCFCFEGPLCLPKEYYERIQQIYSWKFIHVLQILNDDSKCLLHTFSCCEQWKMSFLDKTELACQGRDSQKAPSHKLKPYSSFHHYWVCCCSASGANNNQINKQLSSQSNLLEGIQCKMLTHQVVVIFIVVC